MRDFIGCWQNTAVETSGLKSFSLSEKLGVYSIQVQGPNEPVDWGEHPVESFRFQADEAAFYSQFNLLDMAVDLMAYTNKGLIVVAMYLEFEKNPERNYLSREFFIPVPGVEKTL